MCRLLIVVASLVTEHGLQGAQATVVGAGGLNSCSFWALEHRLGSCGTQAQLLHGMWDLPRSGIKTVSPAPADRFFISGLYYVLLIFVSVSVPVLYCFDYCSFVEQLEVRENNFSSPVLFSSNCFGYQESCFDYQESCFSIQILKLFVLFL